MTATIDLVLLGPELKSSDTKIIPLLEVKTLFYNFSDTSGIFRAPESDKAILIEKLFSDLQSNNPKTLMKIKIVNGFFTKTTKVHLRLVKDEKSSLIYNYSKQGSRKRYSLTALSLNEFLEIIGKVSKNSSFWSVNSTIPAIAYLKSIRDVANSNGDLWILPLIGSGLSQSLPDIIPDYRLSLMNIKPIY